MALPVALQLYSVRDELEADFEGTIAKVREFGYDGVEFAGGVRSRSERYLPMRDLLQFRLMFRSMSCSETRRR